MTLQRLIITFKSEELVMHALYRSQDGPNPGTKGRRKEITALARAGLRDALEALEGHARSLRVRTRWKGVRSPYLIPPNKLCSSMCTARQKVLQ